MTEGFPDVALETNNNKILHNLYKTNCTLLPAMWTDALYTLTVVVWKQECRPWECPDITGNNCIFFPSAMPEKENEIQALKLVPPGSPLCKKKKKEKKNGLALNLHA